MESNYRNPGPPMGYHIPPSGPAAPPMVRFGDWIGEGWRMFTEQWKGWVTIALGLFAVIVIPTLLMIVFYMVTVTQAVEQASRSSAPPDPTGFLMIYLGFFGMMLLLTPLSVFLLGGMYRAAFKQLRGGKVEFKDLFSAKDCYLRLLGGALLMYLIIMIGYMLCMVPGLIAMGLLFFTLPLIVERNMGVIDAMKLSYEVTKPNMLMFTLFAFVVGLIASAGAYACYVGLLATYPLMFTIHAVAFRDCFGLPGARSFAQQLPPPSIYAPPQQPPMSQYPPMSQHPPMSPQPPMPPQPPPVAQAQPPATAKLCPNCQSKLPATAVFCPKCGTGISKA